MRLVVTIGLCATILAAACTAPSSGSAPTVTPLAPTADQVGPAATGATVRLLFAGDVMLGRDVGPVAAAVGAAIFEDVRFVVSSADLAAANLESPLTDLPHLSDNPNALEADPATASLLAGAGFDLMAVANNHTGDAGPAGVEETMAALAGAGVAVVGGGVDLAAAAAAVVREIRGVRIGFLAFDVSGSGLTATNRSAGVMPYRRGEARTAVEDLADEVDVVVVSLHGLIGYLDDDPTMTAAATDLVAAGAGIVWGHGAHVVHPVAVLDTPGEGRAIVATGLGNLLFDQDLAATTNGMVLEVLVSRHGVAGYRTGGTDHGDRRVHFIGWDLPVAAAVLLDGAWWNLVADIAPDSVTADVDVPGFPMGDLVAAGSGDVTGDGRTDLVAAYRRPFADNPVNRMFADRDLTDGEGRSAHVGVFDPDTLEPVWAAGTLLEPVAGIVVCDGSMALAFDTLRARAIVGTGAWTWSGFGFTTAPNLPGTGIPGCRDIDGDGRSDPVVVDRTTG